MAEIPTIQISPEQLAALSGASSQVLPVTPQVILDRLEELYSPVSEGSKISLDDQLNEGRFSLGTGARANAIRNIVSPGGEYNVELLKELTRDYDPETNKFRTKIGHIDRLAGVTDDDVVKAIGNLIERERSDKPLVRQANNILEATGREGVKQTTSAEKIRKVVETEKERNKILKELSQEEKGSAFLAAYRKQRGLEPGQRLTNTELRNLQARAAAQSSDAISARDLQGAQTKSIGDQTELAEERLGLDRQIASDNNRIQEDSLDITRTQAENNLELGREQVALQRSEIEGRNTRQQELLDHQTAVANKNTDLQLALAQINRSDRQDERAYDRERDDRDRRQALMIMLMQGLGNLGRTIGSGI